jgi:ribose transport system permease protein
MANEMQITGAQRLRASAPWVAGLGRAVWFRAVLALAAVALVWWVYPPRMADGTVMQPWESQLLRDVFFERSIFGLLAIGMTFVIIAGGIDLSVGSMLGMSAICFAVFTLHWRWPVAQAVAATVGVGIGAGLLNGLWVANLRLGLPLMAGVLAAMLAVVGGWAMWWAIPLGLAAAGATYILHGLLRMSRTMQPFAATLAMMVIARGAAKWFSGSAKVQSANVPDFYGWLTTGRVPPLIVVFLGAGTAALVLLQYTRLGRHIYAIGGNAEAARLSGVRVRTVTTLTYIFCGITAALAGIGTVARTTLGDPESGAGYELDAIAAVVIGGTSLMGGRGGVLLTLLGVLTIGFLEKYLSLHGWETWARLMAKGAIIIVAVAMQRQVGK